MRIITTLYLCLLGPIVFAQNMEVQVNNFAQNIAAYFDGYTSAGTNNLGNTMLQGHQIQHGNDNWRIRYSLSLGGTALSSAIGAQHNYNNEVHRTNNLTYLGNANSIFGFQGNTIMRNYWLDEKGNRLVNPTNGQYLYTELSLPGGLDKQLDLVPSSFPYLELRVLKGIVLSGGYFPLGYILRNVEEKGVGLKSSIWAAGIGLQLSSFTDIPGLSWLRFDVSTNHFLVNVTNIQNAYDLSLSENIVEVSANQLDFGLNISTMQGRATLAIPVLKKNFIMAQIGTSSITNALSVNYDFNFKIDKEQVKKDYDVEIDDLESKANDSYVNKSTISNPLFFSFGFLREGKVGEFALYYSNNPTTVITAKFGIRLL